MKRVNQRMRPRAMCRQLLGWTITSIVLAWWLLCSSSVGTAEEAQWIWSPEHTKDQVPQTSCYFRRSFSARSPERVQVTITADDQYELYVNGHQVGAGESYRQLDEYNITEFVKRGRNTIAVKVTNRRGPTAALVARLLLKERGAGWVSYSTDGSWRTNLRPFPLWNTNFYNDKFWSRAQSFGRLGETAPWDREEDVASEETPRSERFSVTREFEVQRVIGGDDTGSLIAMAFNEFGQILASREGGPLLLVADTDKDQVVDDVRVYCDKVTNVQGILPLNGDVYVTGDGPDGNALYHLSDQDRDGTLEHVKTMFQFEGEMGEHGAHGLTLGPDGLIYVVLGNHTSPLKEYEADSPHRGYYPGDLVTPRYEDPGGHAAGRKAPGGVILRTDLEGNKIELVAGGLRNAYDLAFNADGELFIHDSDMESDLGTTWYRPTRICHVVPGAELGWRSGWAKFPEYFVDSLPAIADTGRGSPTGAVFYHHFMFPHRFQDALFLADWSEGRILVVKMKKNGASYTADTEVFLQGRPLNVTDLDVGPDGWLYFVTGGRGTGGGIYRVTWKGQVPESVRDLGTGIAAAIRQPQLQSAWGRQAIAAVQQKIGEDWGPMLLGVARSTSNPTQYRIRALDLMQLYGPSPAVPLLIELSQDKNEIIRAKAAELMGIYADEETHERLIALLDDSDRTVRRKACEAMVRADQTVSYEHLVPLLVSDDRFESWAARRLLERCPSESWRPAVLSADDYRLLVQGALALMIAEPSEENARAVIQRIREVTNGFVTDRDFIDMLRVLQVAIMQGHVGAESLAELRDQLVEEFPAGNARMNRELARLLAFLQADSIMDRYFEYLHSDAERPDKMHLAMYMRFLQNGWTTERKLELLKFMAEAKTWDGGGSYPLYLSNAARDFARQFTPEESIVVLKRGVEWPDAALGALYKLPKQLDDDLLVALRQLDEAIDQKTDLASKQLMVGIVAVLARSGDAASQAYLREIWDRNPERREPVAMGLAQSPDGENWDYLVRSLPIVENTTAREVLRRVVAVNKVPDDPEYFRHVILCALRLKEKGARDALAVLEVWTGQQPSQPGDDWQQATAAWQQWFRDTYPDYPDPTLPVDTAENKWKYDELMDFVANGEGRSGDPAKGAIAFEKATCNKCHQYGDRGEAMGPDLTTVRNRFTQKEILQSILFPSHVISGQYAAKTLLLLDGRQIAGIVGPGPEGEKIVLQSDGQKVSVPEREIDEIMPSKTSAMPTGLLNEMSLDEIADLFAYLKSPPGRAVTRRITSDEDPARQ